MMHHIHVVNEEKQRRRNVSPTWFVAVRKN